MNTELIKYAKENYKISLKRLINKVCKVTVVDFRGGEHTFTGLILDTETPYFINFSHPVEHGECLCGEIGLSLSDEDQKSVYLLKTLEHITAKEYKEWVEAATNMDLAILRNCEHLTCNVNYPETKKY